MTICSECRMPCERVSPFYKREMHESCERTLNEALDAMPSYDPDDEGEGRFDPFN